jgi:hypothetical protein
MHKAGKTELAITSFTFSNVTKSMSVSKKMVFEITIERLLAFISFCMMALTLKYMEDQLLFLEGFRPQVDLLDQMLHQIVESVTIAR